MTLSTVLLTAFAILSVKGAPQTNDFGFNGLESVDGEFYPDSEELSDKPEEEFDLNYDPDLFPDQGAEIAANYDGSVPDSGAVENDSVKDMPENEAFELETAQPDHSSSSSSSSSVLTSSVRDGSCSPLHYPCGERFPGCCEDAPVCKCDRLHFCSCRYRAGPVAPPVKYVAPKCQKMYHPCGKDFPKCCGEVPVCHCHDNQKWRCVCVEEYEGSVKQEEEAEEETLEV